MTQLLSLSFAFSVSCWGHSYRRAIFPPKFPFFRAILQPTRFSSPFFLHVWNLTFLIILFLSERVEKVVSEHLRIVMQISNYFQTWKILGKNRPIGMATGMAQNTPVHSRCTNNTRINNREYWIMSQQPFSAHRWLLQYNDITSLLLAAALQCSGEVEGGAWILHLCCFSAIFVLSSFEVY